MPETFTFKSESEKNKSPFNGPNDTSLTQGPVIEVSEVNGLTIDH